MTLEEFKNEIYILHRCECRNRRKMKQAEDMSSYDLYMTGMDEEIGYLESKGEGYLDGKIDALETVKALLEEVDDGRQV